MKIHALGRLSNICSASNFFSKSHSSHRIALAMLSETCTLFFFFLADSSSLSWTKVSLEFKADEVLEFEAEEEGGRRLFNNKL